jgi:pilus assembly protein Flp/PilA
MRALMRFFKEEEGVTALEYALIAALIAVFIIGAVTAAGQWVSTAFQTIADAIAGAIGGGGAPPAP